MDSEAKNPGVAPPAAAPAAAAVARPKPRFDQRWVAPILVTAILLGAHFSVGILRQPEFTLGAIASAVLTELVLGRFMLGKWPHLASAYVTGISVGILIRSPFLWPYLLCSAISITSKYVIRWKGRHLWNPSNLGIVAMVLLGHDATATLSIHLGSSLAPMAVIWALGLVIISRLRRLNICLTYAASFVALGYVRHLITGRPYFTEIGPITGSMYQLFVFFMITDPKTTVQPRWAQSLVAFLIAVVECVIRLLPGLPPYVNSHAPYLALFLVGPTANAIEIWQQGRRKPAPRAPDPVAA